MARDERSSKEAAMNHKKSTIILLFVCIIGALIGASGCGEKEPEGSPVQPANSGATERGAGAGPNRASTAAPE